MSRKSSQSKRRQTRRPFLFSALVGALVASGAAAQTHDIDDHELTPWGGYSDPNQPYSRSGGHAVVVGGHASTGIAAVIENHGAPGGTIRVTTKQMPPDMSAQISFGALRDGFEVIKTGYVDMGGRFDGRDTVQVTIPDWVQNDRPYLLIVSDLEYHPFAPAEMVHPTDIHGMVRREGLVKREPTGGCLTLTGESDELYYLTGNTAGLVAGEEARIEARIIQNTSCGIGTTLEVRSSRRVAQR